LRRRGKKWESGRANSSSSSAHQVVEITPIGIQTLQWKFYIIWTLFNAAFVPIVYLFYPVRLPLHSPSSILPFSPNPSTPIPTNAQPQETSSRTLEDIDRLFRTHPSLLVCKDPDAISSTRPLAYAEHYTQETRRNSSAVGGNAGAVRERLRGLGLEKVKEGEGWGHVEGV